jgi:hypothetical protein
MENIADKGNFPSEQGEDSLFEGVDYRQMGANVPGLLFKVRADGKEYRIFANGRVEGFGENVQIFNYFLHRYADLLKAEQDFGCSAQDTRERKLPQDEAQVALLRD